MFKGIKRTIRDRRSFMPRKRPLEVRMAEAEMKMEDMKLEMAIKELREKRAARTGRRRRRRRL